MKIIVITLLLTACACNNSSQNSTWNDSMTPVGGSIKTIKDTLSPKEINDSTIEIRFPKDSTWVTVTAKTGRDKSAG